MVSVTSSVLAHEIHDKLKAKVPEVVARLYTGEDLLLCDGDVPMRTIKKQDFSDVVKSWQNVQVVIATGTM